MFHFQNQHQMSHHMIYFQLRRNYPYLNTKRINCQYHHPYKYIKRNMLCHHPIAILPDTRDTMYYPLLFHQDMNILDNYNMMDRYRWYKIWMYHMIDYLPPNTIYFQIRIMTNHSYFTVYRSCVIYTNYIYTQLTVNRHHIYQ